MELTRKRTRAVTNIMADKWRVVSESSSTEVEGGVVVEESGEYQMVLC